jgi:hypothetical protein
MPFYYNDGKPCSIKNCETVAVIVASAFTTDGEPFMLRLCKEHEDFLLETDLGDDRQ